MALNFTIQQVIRPEFGRKCETECLNIRFPLPTLVHPVYNVKLEKYNYNMIQYDMTQSQKNNTDKKILVYLYMKLHTKKITYKN